MASVGYTGVPVQNILYTHDYIKNRHPRGYGKRWVHGGAGSEYNIYTQLYQEPAPQGLRGDGLAGVGCDGVDRVGLGR